MLVSLSAGGSSRRAARRRRIRAALVVAVTFYPAALLAQGSSAASWIEAKTAHFTVLSNAGETRARRVAGLLERARAVLSSGLAGPAGLELAADGAPVVVFALARAGDLRELVPQFWETGGRRPVAVYWPGPHRHYIAVRVDRPEGEWQRHAAHELVHLFVRTAWPDTPAWLDEALAERWAGALDERPARGRHEVRACEDNGAGGCEARGGDEADPVVLRSLSASEALVARARAIVDGQRPEAARPLLAEAVRANPDDPAALETLGILNFRQNRPEEAGRWLDRAIETGRAGHLAHFYRAVLLSPGPAAPSSDEADATRRAEDHLQQAIALDPTFAPAYARLGTLVARDHERLQEAIAMAQRAAELRPDDARYWLDLGRLLLGANRRAEARAAGERAARVARAATERERAGQFLRTIFALDRGVGKVCRWCDCPKEPIVLRELPGGR